MRWCTFEFGQIFFVPLLRFVQLSVQRFIRIESQPLFVIRLCRHFAEHKLNVSRTQFFRFFFRRANWKNQQEKQYYTYTLAYKSPTVVSENWRYKRAGIYVGRHKVWRERVRRHTLTERGKIRTTDKNTTEKLRMMTIFSNGKKKIEEKNTNDKNIGYYFFFANRLNQFT